MLKGLLFKIIERLCSWPNFVTCPIYYNSKIWIINHKYTKKFSSIFMQVRAKRDLYDISRMIKVDVDGFRGISRATQCAGMSQRARGYLEECRGILRKNTES